MTLIRRHRISLLINEPLSGKDKEIIDYISDKLSNLDIYISKQNPGTTFYIEKSKSYIVGYDDEDYLWSESTLRHNTNYDSLWCSQRDFYGVLVKNYNLDREEATYIIKYMLNKCFM